jgi:hypothetical protein
MIAPATASRCTRSRCNKNQRVEDELRKMQRAGHPYFLAVDIAKRTNHVTNGIGNVLRFTAGVTCEGKGLWRFTGELVEVLVRTPAHAPARSRLLSTTTRRIPAHGGGIPGGPRSAMRSWRKTLSASTAAARPRSSTTTAGTPTAARRNTTSRRTSPLLVPGAITSTGWAT